MNSVTMVCLFLILTNAL